MRASHLLGLLIVLPTLAGCNVRESEPSAHAAQFAADEATCTGYGFKKDTPEFANCLMELDQTHKGYAIVPQRATSQTAINQGQAIIQSTTPRTTTCTPTSSGVMQCY
jgi:hypothetical protein